MRVVYYYLCVHAKSFFFSILRKQVSESFFQSSFESKESIFFAMMNNQKIDFLSINC
jgi:hypothetical protein